MRCLSLVIVLTILAQPAAAQLPSWLRPGTRLRLTADSARRPLTGALVRFDADSVTVQPYRGQPVSVPLATVQRVEVSRERGTKAWAGGKTGLILGFSFGALAVLGNDDVGNQGLGVLVFGGMFGALGAGLGGLIGSGIATDRWEPIPLGAPPALQPRVGVAPGRLTVGVTIHWGGAP